MSKRLSKRQLREQQELSALRQAGDSPSSEPRREDCEEGEKEVTLEGTGRAKSEEEKEEASIGHHNTGKGIFAQLEQGDDSLSPDEEPGEKSSSEQELSTKSKAKNKKKKKKNKSAAGAGTSEADQGKEGIGIAHMDLKKKSGNVTKQSTSKGVADMSMDEFSALLASQAKVGEGINIVEEFDSGMRRTLHGPLSAFRGHLVLSAPTLDPAVELRRQFGAAAIRAYENEANATSGGRSTGAASASARARAMAWNTNFKVRSILVQPQESWPPISQTFTGMNMKLIEDSRLGKIGGWEHSRAYRKAQLEFLQAVRSYEPNHLMSLFQRYPWHIDTLLQLSDVSRHQGDLGQASDWNARALFAYERTSTTIFSSSLISPLGPPLLAFNRIENRGFWIACHRHINFMGRRGTWRTALEWVKLMLGLDPTYDHHGMILWLDFLSIKSRQHAWFLSCLGKMERAYSAEVEERGDLIVNAKTPFDDDKELIEEGVSARGALDWCLGCNFAKALALRAVERESGDKTGRKSTAALRLAIARHPQLLPLLFDKIGLAFPNEMKSSSLFSFDNTGDDNIPQILSHIYVSRSESLWREADISTWLLSTLREIWPTLQQHAVDICPPAADGTSREGIYRHVLVSDLPDVLRQKLIGLLPHRITSESDNLNAYDPLPPTSRDASVYDDVYFEPVTRERSRRQQDEDPGRIDMMTNLMIEALQGRRGMEHWGPALENMDEETRLDAMRQIMDMSNNAARRRDGGPDSHEDGLMPGTFLADRDDRELPASSETRDSFAAIRHLFGNLWGSDRSADVIAQADEQRQADGENDHDDSS